MIAGPEPTTNGRRKGRFAKGGKGGPGNPHIKHVAALRNMLYAAVTPERFLRATEKIMEMAENGDVMAYREITNRLIGKPKESVELMGRDGSKLVVRVMYVRGRRNTDD